MNSAVGWERVAYWISERAYLLYTEGHYKQALTLLEGLIELDPANQYYRDSASALHLAMGNPREAIRYASGIIQNEPENVNAIVRRCEGYLLLGMPAEARQDLDHMVALGAAVHVRRMAMRLRRVESAGAVAKGQNAPVLRFSGVSE